MTDVVTIALIAAIPSTIAAVLSHRNSQKIDDVHLQINSRLDELLRVTKESAHAAGLAEGRNEPR